MKKFLAKFLPFAYGRLFNIMVLFNKKATAKKALDVFSTIRKGHVLPNQKKFLDDAKLEKVTVANHEIQVYRWKGNKATVLLLHGWESNSFRWRNLINKLKEQDFNILAFDAPAHGYSSGKKMHVPLYAEVTRYFLDKYRPQYVVAHSVGGMVIHYTHYLDPDSSVEKVVTVGSPADFEEFMNHYQGLLKFNNKVREAMNESIKDSFGYQLHEFTSTRFVENNTIKGLLFHDEDDPQVSVEESKKVHQHWKGSELIITKGLGHSMHQDQVNEKIIDFLASNQLKAIS